MRGWRSWRCADSKPIVGRVCARRRSRAAIGIAPSALFLLRNALTSNPATDGAVQTGGQLSLGTVLKELSYTWQLFLPRLPGMTLYFKGVFPLRELWFDRSVGFYGWMDTTFPTWVDNVALVLALGVAALCGRELFVRRGALWARLPEFAAYGAIVVGVMLMLGLLLLPLRSDRTRMLAGGAALPAAAAAGVRAR